VTDSPGTSPGSGSVPAAAGLRGLVARVGRDAVDRELDAAGIPAGQRRSDYRVCRALAAEHGRSYFLATRFLPPGRRPAVHALYGFARRADDVVDDPSPTATVARKTAGLHDLADQCLGVTPATDPTVRAALDVAARYRLEPQLFVDFLASMEMDLTVQEYETDADLARYVHGSAAVIGLMVLPILGTVVPPEEAAPFAADLGVAFQLTNFLRDVGEDLALGRIYLPQTSLRAFGVDRQLLAAETGRTAVDPRVRALLASEIERTRAIYRRAEPGIGMLAPGARRCVRAAFRLYGGILDAIEAADHRVFGERVRVSRRRRAAIAAGTLLTGSRAGPPVPDARSSALSTSGDDPTAPTGTSSA
jgi:phytoene synthase